MLLFEGAERAVTLLLLLADLALAVSLLFNDCLQLPFGVKRRHEIVARLLGPLVCALLDAHHELGLVHVLDLLGGRLQLVEVSVVVQGVILSDAFQCLA